MTLTPNLFLQINWSRLQRDVNNVTTKIAEGDQKKKDWTAKVSPKLDLKFSSPPHHTPSKHVRFFV